MNKIAIRNYKENYIDEVLSLFYDTVHNINIKDYSQNQVDAWATKNIDTVSLNKSLIKNYSIVAIYKEVIVGFADFEKQKSYLNRLYVHKDYQRCQVGKSMLLEIESFVKSENIKKIITEASITARGFFEHFGYKVLKEQNVEKNKEYFINYLMQKEF